MTMMNKTLNAEIKNLNELNLDDLEAVNGGTGRGPKPSKEGCGLIDWIISLFD